MQNITVFCGSNHGSDAIFTDEAIRLGHLLARHKVGLVYGGGNVGLMGKIADAVLEKGGKVIGVIPDFMVDKELAHEGATQMVITKSMHERKAKMMQLSDAFIAMPGGIGTLEELIETYTWLQLRIIDCPIGLLNVEGYYDPLIEMLDKMVEKKFLKNIHRNRLLIADDPETLLAKIFETQYSFEETWHVTD
jgi:uncharacterized protein (TIGR00730 family)